VIDRKKSGYVQTVTIDESDFMRYVLPRYRSFFAKAAAAYQKCLYFHSPPGEFWGNANQESYDLMLAQLAALAKQSRFIVIDSTPFFSILSEYRRDKWHFSTNRREDWDCRHNGKESPRA
jgi:hypothetical protein